ncbi:MAG TPA: aminotransferase class I/II-fold pyridoxal phosphate-dependent enzyme [bacterium]|jgi:histidinol-phosphate/aromatic aminotransferase/cobyric acid decarboxylase-like protein|nr:aminotransferase class I/II-fold pyridoxal phosphate-dependent enzyme [bacterium]
MPSDALALFEHGGDLEKAAQVAGCRPDDLLDFSNLLNPCGPPPGLADYLKTKVSLSLRHPSAGRALREKIADRDGLSPEQIFLGAGTTEFIRLLPWVKRPEKPFILGPTYGEYEKSLRLFGAKPRWIMAQEEEGWVLPPSSWEEALSQKPDWLILSRPNNPLGRNFPREVLLRAVLDHPDTFFVVDETCLEISMNPEDGFLPEPFPSNLAVLRSFSKAYAVPGLRLGYLVVAATQAGLLAEAQAPWTVSPLALEAGLFLLEQDKWLEETGARNTAEKMRIEKFFLGLTQFQFLSSVLPAFMVKGKAPGFSSGGLLEKLLVEEKILIRSLAHHRGLGESFFRIGLRTPPENDRLLAALESLDRF